MDREKGEDPECKERQRRRRIERQIIVARNVLRLAARKKRGNRKTWRERDSVQLTSSNGKRGDCGN
eukprot:855519-Pleurochrysis_carterae.AAC.2